MMMKKYLACLLAAMMMCGAAVACGGNSSNESAADAPTETTVAATEAETTAAETTTAADSEAEDDEDGEEVKSADVEFEDAISAEDGQAYLAIQDGQVWIQYWGDASKPETNQLAYNAGVADIKGDGQYTVSVTADTNGFRYDTTGDVNDQYIPEGLKFMAVMIPNGEKMYPGIILTVDSIKVDGKEIEMVAKNYTSSDDGIETRTNLYNSYMEDNKPSQDARTTEGPLFDGDGNALDICADYAPQVINPSDFAKWTTIEVTFTVSGMDGAAAAEDGSAEEAETAAEGEDAETTAAEDAETTAAEDAETTAAE